MRAAVVEFVSGLDLHGVTLAGESLGGTLALSASIDLKDRVSRVVAFNSYDGKKPERPPEWTNAPST